MMSRNIPRTVSRPWNLSSILPGGICPNLADTDQAFALSLDSNSNPDFLLFNIDFSVTHRGTFDES
jgi:hypothetical protein